MVVCETTRRYGARWCIVLALQCGCGADSGAKAGVPPAAVSDGAPPSEPPAIAATSPCVLNADCPAGQYCDLAECIQDCNVEVPCELGSKCSLRGRCLGPEAPDVEPTPNTKSQGSVGVEPHSVELEPDAKGIDLLLSSTTEEPVRYRVAVDGPHLQVAQSRGSFTGSTVIRVNVDTRQAKVDTSGSIRIVTNLGELVVAAPIRASLSGYYQGSMRFNAGEVSLGDAVVGMEIVEEQGNVRLRVDPQASLLFPEMEPASGSGPKTATTGTGRFSSVDGRIDATFHQRISAKFGGERNSFDRDVLRSLRMQLAPSSLRSLEGTVIDEIKGIFAEPFRITGTVSLRYVPGRPVTAFSGLSEATEPSPIPTDRYIAPRDVFGWTGNGGVFCSQIALVGCQLLPAPAACQSDVQSFMPELVEAQLAPLYQDVSAERTAQPYQDMADRCRSALSQTSFEDYESWDSVKEAGDARGCGLIAPLACSLELLHDDESVPSGQLYSEVVARLAAPALLVAKQEMSDGLDASFKIGLVEEARHYRDALAALRPVTRWLLQPRVLEKLSRLSSDAVKGRSTPSTTSTLLDSYPAGRALAELFYTAASIDGERGRVFAALEAGPQVLVANTVQQSSIFGYLEAATLAALMEKWPSAPKDLAVRATGVLNPLNRGFAALVQGGNVFGAPAGFVPFVYDPAKPGATNFDQMVALAQVSVENEKLIEAAWVAAGREFETRTDKLNDELSNVRGSFDRRLREICGPAFDPAQPTSSLEQLCVGGGTAAKRLEVERALLAFRDSQSRANAQLDKIHIDENAATRTLGRRLQEIDFRLADGTAINMLRMGSELIDVARDGIAVASQAQLLNAGIPVALSAVQILLGAVKVQLHAVENDIRLMGELRAANVEASVEYEHAIDAVRKSYIDYAQLVAEQQQFLLAMLHARMAERNELDEARGLLEERGRVLAVTTSRSLNDPSYRLIRNKNALDAIRARRDAQSDLYLLGKALEFELNFSIGALDGAVLNASNSTGLDRVLGCFRQIANQRVVAFGTEQSYVTTVSVRKLLGITEPRTDDVTGQDLSEGLQFRQLLLRNQNLDSEGGVGLEFATNLDPNNQLWSSSVCSDRIESLQAQLVGDFLGDNEAELHVLLEGTSLMRACDSDAVKSWSLGGNSALAVIQAGVNDFGPQKENTSLFGQAVARAAWRVTLPGSEPANRDIDLSKVDDIVLRIKHRATPRKQSPYDWTGSLNCLSGG